MESPDLRFFDERAPYFNVLKRLIKLGRSVVEAAQALALGFLPIDKEEE